MKIRLSIPLAGGVAMASGVATLCPLAAGSAEASAQPGAPTASEAIAPALRIRVDPRVELLSVLFRLAGNREYNQGRVDSYTADAEKQFGPFRDHAAVKLARELRQRYGVSYDACMSMAVHLRSVEDLSLMVPLEPWPDGLDHRWRAQDANQFIAAARRFIKDTSFAQFVQNHRSLYETTESRMKALMEKQGHLDWFKEYFGERPKAGFTIALGLLNGGCCYGPHFQDSAGKEDLYCVLGVWQTDPTGLPEFTREMLGTIVHEFAHSYANQIMDRHQTELEAAGNNLFQAVSSKMQSQAYGNSQTMLRESLVRACEVRYAFRYDGIAAGKQAIASHKARGFLWMQELSDLLAVYESHRDQYPKLDAFAPRLVAFFKDYASGFAEKQKALESKKPKVVSITPANGAEDVDPGLESIQVVFDRPMRDRSWSLVGGGPHCPETTGKPHYDAARTTWTVPVKLKPDWSYEFMLNSGTYDAFRSEEGVPLEPVSVAFKTTKAAR